MSAASSPVLIMAGGTGGHIFPGLALARELRAREVPVAWLGSAHGLENELVPKAGFDLHTIAVSGLRGKGKLALLAAPFKLARACWQARGVLAQVRPRAVVSMGGFAAGPGGLMAFLTRRPLIVHEQNRVAGLTNRVLSTLARRTFTGFAHTRGLPKAETVGNPVRSDIAQLPSPAARFADHQGPIQLLVLGGSLGARALNQTVPAALALLKDLNIEVLHQCGAKQIEDAQSHYTKHGVKARVEGFIAEMAEAYSKADLVICRAGALTLAELCAAGVGAILVPYPHAVDDHQAVNAEALVQAGGARLIREAQLNADSLAAALRELLVSRQDLQAMGEAARRLAKPDATARLADWVLQEARA